MLVPFISVLKQCGFALVNSEVLDCAVPLNSSQRESAIGLLHVAGLTRIGASSQKDLNRAADGVGLGWKQM